MHAIAYFRVASVSKRVFVQNFSYENEFDLQENGRAGETYSVHENSLALTLVLTQKQTRTREWAFQKTSNIAVNKRQLIDTSGLFATLKQEPRIKF